MAVPRLMPQDFGSSGFEQIAAIGAIGAYDARCTTGLARGERELRKLRRWWAHTEAGRRDL